QEAGPGEPVTLVLDREIDVSRGDVIAAEAAAPKAAEGLEAWIVWMDETPLRELALNEIGRVSISLTHPVVCEPYEVNRDLGGFILIDRLTRGTVGAGMVTAIRARN